MTRHDRLFTLLKGGAIDPCLTGFWIHFKEECRHGEEAVRAHMDFIKETNTDILKIMNENILYDGAAKIMSSSDIHKFRGFTKKDSIMQDQMEIIKKIKDSSRGEYPLLATIHGLLASLFHETGFAGNFTSMGYCVALFCRERPQEMKLAMELVTETLMEFTDISLEAGAEGIFYAALGGEKRYFTDEEYGEFVLPYEQRLYDYIKSKTDFNVLHICKSGIDFNRYTTLKPAIVNWGVYTNQLSLTEGLSYFPDSILLGGFPDRTGVLVNGTKEEIFAHTRKVLEEMEGRPFIVGSDCTLPTEISYERIGWVKEAVEEMTHGNQSMD